MKQLSCLLFGLALLGLMQLPVVGQDKKDDPKAKPPTKKEEPKKKSEAVPAPPPASCCAPGAFKHLDGRPLVLVANGAGGSTTASENLVDVNGELQLGLRIQMIGWCRHDAFFPGPGRQRSPASRATRLSCMVAGIRKDCPNSQIFFVGHSAGTRVILAAAEMLPEKSVDRIFLMASAVSCTYDLTLALKASRYGIDNFWSSEDGMLEAAVWHGKTADGTKLPCAGKVGFRLPCPDKAYKDAYRNLRQYRWNEEMTGNGGHSAWILRHNLKKCVVPLFTTFTTVEPAFTPPPPVKMTLVK